MWPSTVPSNSTSVALILPEISPSWPRTNFPLQTTFPSIFPSIRKLLFVVKSPVNSVPETNRLRRSGLSGFDLFFSPLNIHLNIIHNYFQRIFYTQQSSVVVALS